VQDAAGETADVFFGTSDDENLGDSISLTVIATGFEAGSVQQNITRKDTIQTTQPITAVIPPVVAEPQVEVTSVVEELVEAPLEEVMETLITEVLVAEEETVVVAEVSGEETVEEEVVVEEETVVEENIISENEVVVVEEIIVEAATVVTEEEVIENEFIVAETETLVEDELTTVTENEVVTEEAVVDPVKIVFSLEDEVEEEVTVAVEDLTEALTEEDVAVNDSIVFTAGNGYENEVEATEEVVAENTVEEVTPNATIFEFEFDNNTVAQEEVVAETPEVNNDLFGSMTVFTKEETQEEVAKEANPLMQHVQQTTYDRVRQLEKLSNRFNNQHVFNELEKVPAYKRKNIQLDFNTQPSAQNNASEYNYNRNDDGTYEIRKNNSHISDNVD
jgi:cell division protein FtsZ